MPIASTCNPSEEVPLTVHIKSRSWGSEIRWTIDGGNLRGPYANHGDFNEDVALCPGEHDMILSDTYGDGWHGGYWEILHGAQIIAGGQSDGQVSGRGGTVVFTVSAQDASPPPGPMVPITVHIHAYRWASEILWSVDDGEEHGRSPHQYQNHREYFEHKEVSPGTHDIILTDTYGDGWHGGYWEICPGHVTGTCSASIAGGPSAGQVRGRGGTVQFTVA